MAALAKTDVTAQVTDFREYFTGYPNKEAVVSFTFGDATKTYPTGGVPLPDIEDLGFSSILFSELEPPPTGLTYRYDRTNHKVLIFDQGVTTGATAAAGGTDTTEAGALATGIDGTEINFRIPKTAISTTYHLGALKEAPATYAPAATTIYVRMIGAKV